MYHILTTPHITIRPSGSWDCLHAWSPDVKCIWHELYKPVSRLSKLQPVSQSFSQPSLSILVQLLAPNIPNHCKPSQTIQKTSSQKHLRHIPKHPKIWSFWSQTSLKFLLQTSQTLTPNPAPNGSQWLPRPVRGSSTACSPSIFATWCPCLTSISKGTEATWKMVETGENGGRKLMTDDDRNSMEFHMLIHAPHWHENLRMNIGPYWSLTLVIHLGDPSRFQCMVPYACDAQSPSPLVLQTATDQWKNQTKIPHQQHQQCRKKIGHLGTPICISESALQISMSTLRALRYSTNRRWIVAADLATEFTL